MSVIEKLKVPFVDLRAQHDEVRGAVDAAIARAIDNSAFIGGSAVEGFEKAFAEFCGVPHAVGVGSGTDALRLALQALGVRAGEGVITVAHTFIASAEAVTQLGAVPIFVDVDADSQCMSPAALARLLETGCERTADGRLKHRATGLVVSAVVPVHLYGQSADMAPLLELCDRFGLPLLEDACQAHGASYVFADGSETRCGAMGRAAAFSFYPGKNLGAMGEAGAIVTTDAAIARQCRILRDHGQTERYVHATAEGSNARLDAIQAAVLEIKLSRVETWNARRREIAQRYDAHFAAAPGLVLTQEMPYANHVYHLYVIGVEDRERVRRELDAVGVATGLHYPIPVHLQEAYAHLGYTAGSLPNTEDAAARCLSLPMFPHMTDEMVDHVAEQVLRIVTA